MKAIIKEKMGNKTTYIVTEPKCCGYGWQLTRVKGHGTYARICSESPEKDDIHIIIEEYEADAHPHERGWWDSSHVQTIVSAAWKDIVAQYPYVTKK